MEVDLEKIIAKARKAATNNNNNGRRCLPLRLCVETSTVAARIPSWPNQKGVWWETGLRPCANPVGNRSNFHGLR